MTDLAAWPVLSGLLFLTRAPAVALPEVVIALFDEQGKDRSIWQFSAKIGWIFSGVLAVLSFTPLSKIYFQTLIGVNQELSDLAVTGARIGLLLPIATAVISYYRGALTAQKKTMPVTFGMVAELAVVAGTLILGVFLEAPGIPVAAIAMTAAMGVDGLVLLGFAKKSGKGLALDAI